MSIEARNNLGVAVKAARLGLLNHQAAQHSVASTPVPGERVCVIGAGPAGLTAARELAALGYKVTVLERER